MGGNGEEYSGDGWKSIKNMTVECICLKNAGI